MKLVHRILLLTVLFIGINEASAQRAKDGNYTATGAGEVLNTYTSVTASVAAGATSASVSNINDLDDPTGTIYNSTTLQQGDFVMIIQMYGADVDIFTWYVESGYLGSYTVPTSYNVYQVPGFWGIGTETFGQIDAYNQAGKYEVLEVLNVTGNTIEFTCPTVNSYDHQNTISTDGGLVDPVATASFDNGLQIVRIPRFDNLTVNGGASIVPNQWDGQTGGIVALEVNGTLDIQGTISSSGFGFRGGELDPGPSLTGQSGDAYAARFLGTSDAAQGSERGESIFGWHDQTDFLYSRWGRGAIANSGAGGGYQNAGGGGGSNVENSGLSYDGRGRPDPAYAASWALDSEPGETDLAPWPRTTPNSSGGGRGGYALSESNEDELTEGPDLIQWAGDTRKSNGGLGGHPLTYDNTRMFFGGGGGAGDWDSQYGGIPQGGAGGNGGGIVFIQSYGTITGNGTIESNGADGGKTNPANANPPGGFSNAKCGNDGAGGGGAGGWIHIENATALPGTLNLTVIGGNGGDQDLRLSLLATSEAGGPGGAGSGGAIEYTAGAPTESVISGVNGVTTSPDVANFEPNGATNGNSGMSGLTAPYYDLVGTGATICVGQTANISVAVLGTLPSGSNNADITWYTTEYGNNPAPGANTGLTYTTSALAATTTYYVGLCPGTFRIPVTVTVGGAADLVITDPAPICSPGMVDLTDPAVTAGSDPGTLTYWTDAGATSTLASPATVGTSGTYYIQLDAGGGCTDIQPVTVTITPAPTLIITDPAAVCSPGTVDLTAPAVTAGSGAGTLTYWTDAGATSTLASPVTVGTTGTYYIQLDLGGGCAVVEPVNVTVNAQPNLVITDPAAVCSPNTVDLTAAAVTVGSDAGTLTYWTDLGATSTLATPGAVGTTGTYYIQLEDGNTCTDIQPVNVTVTSGPNLVITDPAAVCSPATVDLTTGAVTAGSDAGTLTYWTDAAATSTLATPGTVGTAGTYYIQLEDGNTCTTVQPVNATINAQPNLVITDPAAVCSPNTVDLTAAAVTAGSDAGTLTYWTDAGATSTLATPGTVGTTGTYYIQLEDGNTCTTVQPVNATINAQPNLVITDPAAVCSPATVDLTAGAVTAGSDAGTLTYWTDAGATSTLATPGAVGTTGTYYIQLEDGNTCTTVQPVNVTVTNNPTLVITDPAAVCSPGTADLTDPAVTAGSDVGTLTYWTDAGVTSTLVTPGTVGASGTYYIQLEIGGGCTVVQPVNVTINTQPNLIITDPAAVCSPGAVDITAGAVTAGSDAGTLTYWTDAGATSTLVGPGTIGTSGTYYIQLEDANTCTDVQPVNVSITAQDDATFNLIPECEGASAIIIGLSGGSFAFSVAPTDGALLDASTGYITNATGGTTYSVEYTTNGACPNSSLEQVIALDCTQDTIVVPTAITPNGDLVNDKWDIQNLDNAYPNNTVTIYNRWGNMIFQHNSSPTSPYYDNMWDGTHNGEPLPVGSYFYVIEFNDGSGESENGTVTIVLNK
jgi:gliding motility-associated-like protein